LVDVPFTYADNTFKGSFKINRKDFAIGGNSMTMGDEVMLSTSRQNKPQKYTAIK
jgi:polyisoprenoid-binding protein YceI